MVRSFFFCLQEALKVMEFTEEEIRDMFKLLSGVLQLGNVEFMTAGGAQITTKQGERCHSSLTDRYIMVLSEYLILLG